MDINSLFLIIKKEGFHEEWIDPYTGYKCEINRPKDIQNTNGLYFGTFQWCGYVQLPKEHPYYNSDYHSIPVDVHGGLTYGYDGNVGFDCAHYNDIATISTSQISGNHYWTKYEVIKETTNLARQLKELEKKNE